MDNAKFQEIVLKRFDLLELIAAQVSKLTTQVEKLTVDVDEIKKTLPTLATKEELAEVKNIVVRIENDHGQKLGALLNGYKLHEERLDKHEEIISKKY